MIVFIDETGISERPTRVRTWAPKGQTPVIQFHFNWNHVSAIAGLSRTNYLFRLYEGSVKKEQVVEFLKALKAHLKQPLLIIWDGARPLTRQLSGNTWTLSRATFRSPSCRRTVQNSIPSSICGHGSNATRLRTSAPTTSTSCIPSLATS